MQDEEKTSDEATKELVKEIARRSLDELSGEITENTLEVEVIENPNPIEEGEDMYLMTAKLQTQSEDQTEDTDGEVSIKAIRQRGRYTKEDSQEKKKEDGRQSPWWTSQNAAKRSTRTQDVEASLEEA